MKGKRLVLQPDDFLDLQITAVLVYRGSRSDLSDVGRSVQSVKHTGIDAVWLSPEAQSEACS